MEAYLQRQQANNASIALMSMGLSVGSSDTGFGAKVDPRGQNEGFQKCFD